MDRFRQIGIVLAWTLAASIAGTYKISAADRRAEVRCDEWYTGRIAGYIYWATAAEDDIRLCVETHGVNIKDLYGLAPLHHAISNPNVKDERIKLLIDSGADVNQPGYRNVTPLIMAAAYASNPAIIERLLRSGASPVYVDDWGESALGAIRHNPNMSRRNKKISERLLNKPWNKEASDQ